MNVIFNAIFNFKYVIFCVIGAKLAINCQKEKNEDHEKAIQICDFKWPVIGLLLSFKCEHVFMVSLGNKCE